MSIADIEKYLARLRERPIVTVLLIIVAVLVVASTAWITAFFTEKGKQYATLKPSQSSVVKSSQPVTKQPERLVVGSSRRVEKTEVPHEPFASTSAKDQNLSPVSTDKQSIPLPAEKSVHVVERSLEKLVENQRPILSVLKRSETGSFLMNTTEIVERDLMVLEQALMNTISLIDSDSELFRAFSTFQEYIQSSLDRAQVNAESGSQSNREAWEEIAQNLKTKRDRLFANRDKLNELRGRLKDDLMDFRRRKEIVHVNLQLGHSGSAVEELDQLLNGFGEMSNQIIQIVHMMQLPER